MKYGIAALALGLTLAGVGQAEVVKTAEFEGDFKFYPIKSLDDGTPIHQVFVTVSTAKGKAPGFGKMFNAGAFATKTACGQGEPLATITGEKSATAVQFEILCRGKR